MLERLVVKNVALIDEADVTFSDGLNILTGETGAGKSILIDSINLALGAKADKSLIRQGAEYAFVELVFSVQGEKLRQRLREMEIFPEDGKVVLQRRIMQGKSSCRINGESVSGKVMKDAATVLIDIHGQHEHQSLLSEKKHLEVLDAYCDETGFERKEQLEKVYIKYREAEKEYEKVLSSDMAKDREIALAQFELKEIEEANLKEGEDILLEEEFRRMEHMKYIGEALSSAYQCLSSYGQENAETLLGRASKYVNDAMVYDASLSEASEQLLQAEEMVRDAGRFLQHYVDGLEMDGETYAYTQQRLNTINHLKSKYGNSLEDILSYAAEKTDFSNKFEDFEQYKDQLEKRKKECYEELKISCKKMHEYRCAQAHLLQKKMQDALLELNFPYAQFEILVQEDDAYLSKAGNDHVSFMISLNAGERLKPLTQVASGGELSRIMLALKTVLADKDEMESLIFDEIDAGISGKTAWKVSEKLGVIGTHRQVICITHLPQIAAMADHHFMIEKHQSANHTSTSLTPLDNNGMLTEIARLLGGDVITEATMQNAKELKEMATHAKQY